MWDRENKEVSDVVSYWDKVEQVKRVAEPTLNYGFNIFYRIDYASKQPSKEELVVLP